MALKKSELYASLWSSCDEAARRHGRQPVKDYVLVLLFIKYVSDKYGGQTFAPIVIPAGASFKDMVALKGKPDIGDQINKKIIAPLASGNQQLSQADFPDFNDPVKLGDGKEKAYDASEGQRAPDVRNRTPSASFRGLGRMPSRIGQELPVQRAAGTGDSRGVRVHSVLLSARAIA